CHIELHKGTWRVSSREQSREARTIFCVLLPLSQPQRFPACRQSRLEPQCEGRHPQRAGIAPPHAEGDELSGVISDGETFAFISVPIPIVDGVPLTRARNP